MNSNLKGSNEMSKDLKTKNNQIISEKKEPPINILSKLNSIANENFHQIIPSIVCEICYKPNNLLKCEICQSGFHQKCLGKTFLPEHFICLYCKKHFTKEEITSIINNIYIKKRKYNIDNNKIYKEFEKNKIKKNYPLNTYINTTKIIELDEDKVEDKPPGKKIINTKKRKSHKKLYKEVNNEEIDENIDKYKEKKDKNYEFNNKNAKKDNTNKMNKIHEDNDINESSIMSKPELGNNNKHNNKNKKRKDKDKHKDKNKDKNKEKNSHDLNLSINSSKINKNSSNTNNNILDSANDDNNINDIKPINSHNNSFSNKSLKENNNKDELSLHHSQSHGSKKKSKKKITNLKVNKEESLLLSLTHTDPQYKKRKIKLGANRQCNMYEFTDKYENKINFEEEEYERNDLVQVWSVENNPLSEEELNNYIQTSRLFWNYQNFHIEEDLCDDFFQECEQKMKNKKIQPKLKNKITKLIKELKELLKRGISLNSHYDEMSLRVLHLCKYKTNVALFFLYKGLNPFIEEIEEGFKHDIYFFQDEIYSFINNGDFFDSDN